MKKITITCTTECAEDLLAKISLGEVVTLTIQDVEMDETKHNTLTAVTSDTPKTSVTNNATGSTPLTEDMIRKVAQRLGVSFEEVNSQVLIYHIETVEDALNCENIPSVAKDAVREVAYGS